MSRRTRRRPSRAQSRRLFLEPLERRELLASLSWGDGTSAYEGAGAPDGASVLINFVRDSDTDSLTVTYTVTPLSAGGTQPEYGKYSEPNPAVGYTDPETRDFDLTGGFFVMAPGVTAHAIPIKYWIDGKIEGTETYRVTITSAVSSDPGITYSIGPASRDYDILDPTFLTPATSLDNNQVCDCRCTECEGVLQREFVAGGTMTLVTYLGFLKYTSAGTMLQAVAGGDFSYDGITQMNPVPQKIETFGVFDPGGNAVQSDSAFYDPASLEADIPDRYSTPIQIDDDRESGRYKWNFHVIERFGPTKQPKFHNYSAFHIYKNFTGNEFGGFIHTDIDWLKIYDDGNDSINDPSTYEGAVWFRGDSNAFWFQQLSGNFEREAGELDDSTLVQETDGSYTLRKQTGETLHFDSGGKLMTRTDRVGNVTLYSYGAGGIEEIEYPGGLSYTFGYTGNYVTTITDPYGRVTDLDNDGKLHSITFPDPDGAGSKPRPVLNFTYSSSLLASYTTPEGDTTSFAYVDRLLRTVTHPDGGVETIHATLASGMHTESDGLGTPTNLRPLFKSSLVEGKYENEIDATWYFKHNRAGAVLWVKDPYDNVTQFEVNFENLVTERTDPDPAGAEPAPVTTYEYDVRKLTEMTLPDGSTRSWHYDWDFAQVDSYTNGRGFVTNFTVSATNGNVTQVAIPSLSITASYEYTTTGVKGLVSQVTDPLGRVTTIGYTAHGLVAQVASAVGTADEIIEKFGYDANDNLAWSDDALGRRTLYEYDLLDRLIELTLPDPDSSGSLGAPVYLYDYNKNNYLTRLTDPLSRLTDYDYTSRNDVLEIKQPDPDGGGPAGIPTTTFDYDLHRRLESATDPLGRVTTHAWDLLDRQTTLTLPDPDGGGAETSPVYAWTYDVLSRTTSAIDPLANELEYAYAQLWREVTTTLPDPDDDGPLATDEVEVVYDAEGNLTSTTDELDRTTTYAYDALNRLTSVTLPDPDGGGGLAAPVTQYQYDKANNLRYVIDPLGNTTEYVYDNLNRLVKTIEADPDGGGGLAKPEWLYAYDPVGNLVLATDPLGRKTAYDYDQLDRLVSIRQADGTLAGAATATTVIGGTASEVQRVGFTTSSTIFSGTFTLTYDGQTTSTIAWNASASTVQAALEALANLAPGDVAVTKTADAMNNKQYRLDFGGSLTATNLVQVTINASAIMNNSGLSETEATDVQGGSGNEVQTVTLAGATGGTFRLRFAGDETSAIAYNASSSTLDTALEALASIDSVTVTGSAGGPYTITFTGTHGGHNVLPLAVNSASLTSASPLSKTEYAYDAANRLTSTTDPLGNVTAYEYDNLDRLIELTQPDPDGGGSLTAPTTTFTYDAVGNRLSLTDPVGNTTEWVYDNLDRVTSETNELADVRTFKYDAVGNLTERIDRLGRKTVWEYDNRYRHTNEKWYEGVTLVRTLSFAYTAANELVSASDPAATYSYSYDALSRVTSEGQTLSGLSPGLTFASTFDAASRRTELLAKIGSDEDFLNTYTYDNLHRLTRLEQGSGADNVVAEKRIDFAYNAASQTTKTTRYADLAGSEFVANTFYSYDGLGRLSKLLHTEDASSPGSGWGTDPLAGYAYTYDAASRIASIDSYLDGLTEYDYDNTSQLIGADHTGISDESYTYDENGNRTGGSYDTDPNNQLATDGTYNYTYDDEGNRSRRTKISDSSYEEHTWDHRNRLTKVSFKNSGGTVTKSVDYIYDAFNRLIRRTLDPDGAAGSAALVDAVFSWEADQINLQFDGSAPADLTQRYLWNPAAIDQILAVEDVTSLSSAGTVKWPFTDHLGTARDLASYNLSTNVTTLENHRVFDSYGKLVSQTNGSFTIAVGFTGVYFDTTTSYNYHRNRWHDMNAGRWVSEDPIGFEAGDTNLGRSVGNGPIQRRDPSGLHWLDKFGAVLRNGKLVFKNGASLTIRNSQHAGKAVTLDELIKCGGKMAV